MGGTITIEDAFVRRTLTPLLLIFFLIFAGGLVAAIYVLLDCTQVSVLSRFGFFDGEPSQVSLTIIDAFLTIKAFPESIRAPLTQFLPALVAAICFQASGTALNRAGRTLFLIVLFLIIVGIVTYILAGAQIAINFPRGPASIDVISAYATFCINTGLVYFGLLTGFSISTTATGGPGPNGGKGLVNPKSNADVVDVRG
jgi:hypothetical protein